MTLDGLRVIELSLMRLAFEKACVIVGLPLHSDAVVDQCDYARMASEIQIQVERGLSDVDAIAQQAAEICGKYASALY